MLRQPQRYSWRLIYISLALLFILIAICAVFLFKYQVSLIRKNKYAEISGIARLKSDEIVRWLGERYSDADYFSRSAELKSIITQAGQEGKDSLLHQEFNRVFQGMKKTTTMRT